jgi:hypothetical protein
MTDAEFWGRALLAGLTIWFALSIITAALWAIVAHRPDPWERELPELAERMRAAGVGDE